MPFASEKRGPGARVDLERTIVDERQPLPDDRPDRESCCPDRDRTCHRSDSAPNVTSNLPSVHSLTCAGDRRTSMTSGLTSTGRSPAAALSRSTSLPAATRSSARRGARTRRTLHRTPPAPRPRRPSTRSAAAPIPWRGAHARRDAEPGANDRRIPQGSTSRMSRLWQRWRRASVSVQRIQSCASRTIAGSSAPESPRTPR